MHESTAKLIGWLPYSLEEGAAEAEHALDALAPDATADDAIKALEHAFGRLHSAAKGLLR